jgi:hypothetical protein
LTRSVNQHGKTTLRIESLIDEVYQRDANNKKMIQIRAEFQEALATVQQELEEIKGGIHLFDTG